MDNNDDPIFRSTTARFSLNVPLEGLEPPTCSLGRSRSSIELQRLTRRAYPGGVRVGLASLSAFGAGRVALATLAGAIRHLERKLVGERPHLHKRLVADAARRLRRVHHVPD